jgi:5-methylcytosine-specific restriction endonuclease McrA
MNKNISYIEKLRDPKWQKKRLKILERDNFKCRFCGDKEKTLHVHHTWYSRQRNPWEYEDDSLLTLCCDCHQEETNLLHDMQFDLIQILKQRGFTGDDLLDLATAGIQGKLDNFIKKGIPHGLV